MPNEATDQNETKGEVAEGLPVAHECVGVERFQCGQRSDFVSFDLGSSVSHSRGATREPDRHVCSAT
jgi:hypothetical protein